MTDANFEAARRVDPLPGGNQGDYEAVLELADKRKCEAKRLGKNRVCY